MDIFVVGFLFSGGDVFLIRKNHPEWQNGLLNGIGGKVEIGETPEEAMRREFMEEAGMDIHDWREFATLTNNERDIELHAFTARRRYSETRCIKSLTDEEVVRISSFVLPRRKIIPNNEWLIPMARYENTFTSNIVFDKDIW